jgi:hypothetical protein
MPSLVPGIHVFHVKPVQVVDGRDKPGHDGEMFTSEEETLARLSH